MKSELYVISLGGDACSSKYSYYSEHGEFKGVENVISYVDMANAMKFYTPEIAQAFIDTELPDNARHNHSVVKVSSLFLMSNCPEDYAKLLTWELNRRIEKVTLRINSEDSKGVGIVDFYNRLAAICNLDPENTHFDCTRIHVSRNIQTNIFKVLDAQSSDPCYTGMMWVIRGPKTVDELPDNTVELLDGFFTTPDEKPLPLEMKVA